MRSKIFILFFLLIFHFNAFSESLSGILPQLNQTEISQLQQGDYLKNSSGDHLLEYLPSGELSRTIKTYQKTKTPELFIEVLCLIPRPDIRQEELLLFLFNNIGAVSDQEGLEYRSYNRGNKMYPLIVKSWYIEDPDKKNSIIPDPVKNAMPSEETRYVFQKDTTFGGNYYKHRYITTKNEILLDISNLSEMSAKGLVKIAEEGELQMFFLLIPVNEGILCYSAAFIRKKPPYDEIMGYKVNPVGSFEKRVKVIMDWFQNRIKR